MDSKKPHLDHLKQNLRKTERKRFRENPWGARHAAAFREAGALIVLAGEGVAEEQEQAVVFMLAGWLAYADAHERRYASGVGNDGFLGEHWEAVGDGLRGFLNGELGRLDAGTLDGEIVAAMRREGKER